MINHKVMMKTVSAEKFFQAKILEHEASCYTEDPARTTAAEENCHSALQGMLDAKREQTEKQIEEFKRNNR